MISNGSLMSLNTRRSTAPPKASARSAQNAPSSATLQTRPLRGSLLQPAGVSKHQLRRRSSSAARRASAFRIDRGLTRRAVASPDCTANGAEFSMRSPLVVPTSTRSAYVPSSVANPEKSASQSCIPNVLLIAGSFGVPETGTSDPLLTGPSQATAPSWTLPRHLVRKKREGPGMCREVGRSFNVLTSARFVPACS